MTVYGVRNIDWSSDVGSSDLPVAEDADRQGGQYDHHARRQHDPGGPGQIFTAVAYRIAERGQRRLYAEAEEGQAAFQQDDLGEGQRHRHDQGRGDIGQHMLAVDTPAAGAELAPGGGIALLVGRQGQAASTEERGGGKEGVSKCRSRLWQDT